MYIAESFQNEMPRARVNIKLDLVTGEVNNSIELPLKLLSVGGFSNGKVEGADSEREEINIDKKF